MNNLTGCFEKLLALVSHPIKTVLLIALSVTACSPGPSDPDSGAQTDAEFAFASRVEAEFESDDDDDEDALRVTATLVNNNTIQVSGSGGEGRALVVSDPNNLNVLQLVSRGRSNSDDDEDDDKQIPINLTLTGLAVIPCSLSVQTSKGSLLIPVQNAPLTCSGNGQAVVNNNLSVTRAKWKSETAQLKLKGVGAPANSAVKIYDAMSNAFIGEVLANPAGIWRLTLANMFNPPCVVRASAGNEAVLAVVKNAPATCTNTPVQSPSPGGNLPPDSTIIEPATDTTLVVGTELMFSAQTIDPDDNAPISYLWSFDGAAPNSVEANPRVLFNRAGVFRVTLTVRDSLGLADPTPATRIITVNTSTTTNLPVATMLTPVQEQVTVTAGQFVNFTAVAANAADTPNQPLTYFWDFGGGANNLNVQNPGNVVFSFPGTYSVRLSVVDVQGRVSNAVVRTIVVNPTGTNPPTNSNQSPDGQILQPAALTPINLTVGQSVNFAATGSDPDGNLPLTYFWNFNGGAADTTQQNPTVTFNQVGTFTVSMTVMDALGLSDPVPAFRVVTVDNVTTPPGTGNPPPTQSNLPPDGNITSPAADTTVGIGQSLVFSGTAVDPDNSGTLQFSWDFDGAAPNTSAQNPGLINFTRAGTYRIKLNTIDGQGLADPTPVVRSITVLDSGSTNRPPNGLIFSPQAASMSISVGDAVNFSGSASDPDANIGFTYQWDFDGGAANTVLQNPGNVTFHRAGTYNVSLVVRDNQGVADPTPDRRIIVVSPLANVNQAPVGRIQQPPQDVVINIGESLQFVADAVDPDGDAVTNFSWDFAGAAVNPGNVRDTGLVRFDQAGTFVIKMTATDTQGMVDPLPAERRVIVRAAQNAATRPTVQMSTPPANQQAITAGTALTFAASASNPGGNSGLVYMWDFDGAAADR